MATLEVRGPRAADPLPVDSGARGRYFNAVEDVRIDRLPCANRDARAYSGDGTHRCAYGFHRGTQVGTGLHRLRSVDRFDELFDGGRIFVDDRIEHPRGAARLA